MIHFISGFPRSGTTLLAALLRQNPRFHASIESPLGNLIDSALEAMGPERNEGASLFSDVQRTRILQQIFFGYYEGYPDIVFDTSRRWCAHMGLLNQLFPGSKVIACVRDPRAVVDSFERLFAKHPTYLSRIMPRPNTNVYDRVPVLLDRRGICGYAFNSFREAYFGPFRHNLLVVDYDDLARQPLTVLKWLHEQIGEEPFTYNIKSVEQIPEAKIFDNAVIGAPGLHEVKPSIVFEDRKPILPPEIFNNLPRQFWRAKEKS
jgi:sulfotransferase